MNVSLYNRGLQNKISNGHKTFYIYNHEHFNDAPWQKNSHNTKEKHVNSGSKEKK